MPDFYPKIQEKNFRRHLFEGRELSKMNVGIIGVGNVGFEVAKRLKPFGCKIYAYEKKLEGRYIGSFNKLITKVDILTIHLNLTKENKNIKGACI